MTRIALALALALLAGPAGRAGSIGDLVREAAATGRPQSAQVDGALGRLILQQSGRPLLARVQVLEKLAGDCARFRTRLHLQDSPEELAVIEFAMCADGSAPPAR